MGLCLSHTTAYEIWRRALELPNRGTIGWPPSERAALRFKPAADDIAALPYRLPGFSFLPSHAIEPIHALVPRHDARCASNIPVCCHEFLGVAPRGSIMRIDDDLFITSPELTFVQAAQSVGVGALLRFGFELCGSYAVDEASLYGSSNRAPLCSSAALRRCVSAAQGIRGCKRAQQCARYVLDGSASQMETALAILLCMPHRYGGYGLPMPKMNYRIAASDASKAATGKEFFKADLCWPKAQLIVEYNSDSCHTGSLRIAEDAARQLALMHSGMTVVFITKMQVMDEAKLDQSADFIARKLQFRNRNRTSGWREMNRKLKADMLSFVGFDAGFDAAFH